MKLNADSAQPLYEQLKSIIKEEISRGVYKYGDRIPTEIELCEKYGVSRITARRAVSDLVEENILDRQQGKGTFVKHRPFKSELLAVTGFSEFVETVGKKPNSHVVSKEVISSTPDLEEKLNIPKDAPVLKLVRQLYLDDEPLMLDTAHYPLNRFPNLDQYIEDSLSTYKILKDIYHTQPFSSKRELNIALATRIEAPLLNCEVGEPLFRVEKIAYDKNHIPVHTSVFYAVGSKVTFTVNESVEE
ncbi:GntR family transcriptional regulator [Scopulibacillus cellulosilyticus]|uniref:GntR family transcriptional regulator n=1 Tax=Scopulibacillus cellulosilyticus TaxID=2665665 RepID=A0ABW2Q058_9BACL